VIDIEERISRMREAFALLSEFRYVPQYDKQPAGKSPEWEAFGAPKRIEERMAAVRRCCRRDWHKHTCTHTQPHAAHTRRSRCCERSVVNSLRGGVGADRRGA
jgi:hypothetical protein